MNSIEKAYTRFLNSESDYEWDKLDDSLSQLEWLEDHELIKEAQLLYMQHSTGKVSCKLNHSDKHCFAPIIMDAVSQILKVYEQKGSLTAKHKYIIQYYLGLDHVGFIVFNKK
jgi:hypothetical protein